MNMSRTLCLKADSKRGEALGVEFDTILNVLTLFGVASLLRMISGPLDCRPLANGDSLRTLLAGATVELLASLGVLVIWAFGRCKVMAPHKALIQPRRLANPSKARYRIERSANDSPMISISSSRESIEGSEQLVASCFLIEIMSKQSPISRTILSRVASEVMCSIFDTRLISPEIQFPIHPSVEHGGGSRNKPDDSRVGS
jgi:hypothetical protein